MSLQGLALDVEEAEEIAFRAWKAAGEVTTPENAVLRDRAVEVLRAEQQAWQASRGSFVPERWKRPDARP